MTFRLIFGWRLNNTFVVKENTQAMVTARICMSGIDRVQTTTIVVKVQAKCKAENEQPRVAPTMQTSVCARWLRGAYSYHTRRCAAEKLAHAWRHLVVAAFWLWTMMLMMKTLENLLLHHSCQEAQQSLPLPARRQQSEPPSSSIACVHPRLHGACSRTCTTAWIIISYGAVSYRPRWRFWLTWRRWL